MDLFVEADGQRACVLSLPREHEIMRPGDARVALEKVAADGTSGTVTQKIWKLTNGVRELWAQRVYRVTPGGERLVEGVPYGY